MNPCLKTRMPAMMRTGMYNTIVAAEILPKLLSASIVKFRKEERMKDGGLLHLMRSK